MTTVLDRVVDVWAAAFAGRDPDRPARPDTRAGLHTRLADAARSAGRLRQVVVVDRRCGDGIPTGMMAVAFRGCAALYPGDFLTLVGGPGEFDRAVLAVWTELGLGDTAFTPPSHGGVNDDTLRIHVSDAFWWLS